MQPGKDCNLPLNNCYRYWLLLPFEFLLPRPISRLLSPIVFAEPTVCSTVRLTVPILLSATLTRGRIINKQLISYDYIVIGEAQYSLVVDSLSVLYLPHPATIWSKALVDSWYEMLFRFFNYHVTSIMFALSSIVFNHIKEEEVYCKTRALNIQKS